MRTNTRTRMRVHSDPLLANVVMVKEILEATGIPCEIRGEYLGSASGEIPPVETWPELWVLDESKIGEANQLIKEALRPIKESTSNWTCPRCQEEIEGQFSECWNCDANL